MRKFHFANFDEAVWHLNLCSTIPVVYVSLLLSSPLNMLRFREMTSYESRNASASSNSIQTIPGDRATYGTLQNLVADCHSTTAVGKI